MTPITKIGGKKITRTEWQSILIKEGYFARSIPKKYGGYGGESDVIKNRIIASEFSNHGVPSPMSGQGIDMLVPTLPEPIIDNDEKIVPGLDGRKMSKSYNNVIPLLGSDKKLKKSIMKIVTNSLEPGEPKNFNDCTVFELYIYFANADEINEFKTAYEEGISWGDAKDKLFNIINAELLPIRSKYEDLINDPDYLNDVLGDGAKKARTLAKEKIEKVKEVIGLTKIS